VSLNKKCSAIQNFIDHIANVVYDNLFRIVSNEGDGISPDIKIFLSKRTFILNNFNYYAFMLTPFSRQPHSFSCPGKCEFYRKKNTRW
jgi:hypothetical protein